MLSRILGEDIYRSVNVEYCVKIKEQKEKLKEHGLLGRLYSIYYYTDRYYKENLPKVNFEFFYRFFVQIGIRCAYDIGMHKDKFYMCMKESLATNILNAIVKIPIRCLIQEIHEHKEKGKLHGDTDREEYAFYELAYLKKPEYIREVCQRYPEMLRLLLLRIGQVIEETAEILKNLKSDKHQIIDEVLSGIPFSRISELNMGMSDAHKGGHTVAKIVLDNGKKLIYRPNGIEKNEIFFQMYDWLMKGSGLGSSHRKFLSFSTHSWEEYVSTLSCTSDREVRKYYFRSGVLLFLCYLTYSTDIHGENLIARGEYPELVDLETMPGNRSVHGVLSEKNPLNSFMVTSVLKTGFLPEPCWGKNEKNESPSALHSRGVMRTTIKVPVIYHPFSSQIEIGHDFGKVNVDNSTVKLKGKAVNPQEYVDDICAGFCHAYKRTMTLKDEMSELLEKLCLQKSRYLIRHTQQYDMYLNISYFPEFMKKTENRIYFFYVLKKRKYSDAYTEDISKAELQALLDLDIPIFYFSGDKTDMELGEGEECKDYFEKTAHQCIQSHIKTLCKEDMFRQKMLIRMSVGFNLSEINGSRDIKINSQSDFWLHSAETIGNSLLRWKIKKGNVEVYPTIRCYDSGWNIEKMKHCLYDGNIGLAVCFALLFSCTGKQHFLDECMKLCIRVFRYTDMVLNNEEAAESKQTGMFIGEGSIVYGYLILYKILKKPEFLKYAEKQVTIVEKFVSKDENYDLLSGNAGWIVVLLKLYEVSGSNQYLDMSVEIEKLLWEKRMEFPDGVGWVNTNGKTALSGMSHGNSGIILAYSYLLKCTGEKKYRDRIYCMLKYEDSLYSENEENWKDLRKEENICYYSNAWCHGGSGILLSRLALLRLNDFKDDEIVREDIKRGIRCLSLWEKEDRLCICHGLTGIYLIYKACARVLKKSAYYFEAEKVRKKILETKKIKVQEAGSTSLMAGFGGLVFTLCKADDDIIW